jgi:hypothetical protein
VSFGKAFVSAAIVVVPLAISGCDSRSGGARRDAAAPIAMPCSLMIVPTGVVLRAQGDQPDAGNYVGRNSHGRYFSSTYGGGEIATWDSTGAYVGLIASKGEGPGEMSGNPLVFVDATDSIHARDSRFVWSVFSPDGKYVRQMRAEHLGFGYSGIEFLRDGRALTAHPSPGVGDTTYFQILNRDGAVVKRIGSISPADREVYRGNAAARAISNVVDGRFWAAPRRNSLAGYQLEEWDTSGAMIRSVTQQPSWFTNAMAKREPSARSKPLPYIYYLHLDSLGMLLTYTSVPNKSWKLQKNTPRRDTRMFDYHVDVLDTRSAKRVAHMSGNIEDFPAYFFGSSRTGYNDREASGDAAPWKEIVTYDLSCSK